MNFYLVMNCFPNALWQVAAMREQEQIRTRMQMAWKTGDRKEAERLQELLAPDEDEETLKYKHKISKELVYYEKRNNA